jgi:hypothetical protein
MRREKALGGVAVAVAVGTVLVLVLVPNAIAAPERPEPPEDPAPPTELGIRDVSISDGPVSGATATIEVDVRLTHQGGPAENVTVEVRAIDGESGMVKMTERTDLGDVTRTGERRVRTDLSVPRQGSYRIETIAYLNGTRIDEGTARVSGVGSLTPAYADSPVSFRRTGGFGPAGPLPSVEYAIEDVESVHDGRDRDKRRECHPAAAAAPTRCLDPAPVVPAPLVVQVNPERGDLHATGRRRERVSLPCRGAGLHGPRNGSWCVPDARPSVSDRPLRARSCPSMPADARRSRRPRNLHPWSCMTAPPTLRTLVSRPVP